MDTFDVCHMCVMNLSLAYAMYAFFDKVLSINLAVFGQMFGDRYINVLVILCLDYKLNLMFNCV